jgi:hypothetical protein
MNETPDMLDFVKAMSDTERLRIIGILAHAPGDAARVAAQMGMPVQDAFKHLEQLAFVGVVHKAGDVYELDPGGLGKLAKEQLGATPRQAYVPAPELDAKKRKVLTAYLNADGSLKQIPSQASKLRIILEYLVSAFTPGVDYTEKEVNTILRRFHLDTAGLRRDLVDARLLARESDGSRYWRVE